MIVRKTLRVSRGDYYKKHLEIINVFIPVKMSNRELEIMAQFMEIPEIVRLESKGKKMVMEKLGLSYGGLGNHLKNLRDKGFIIILEGKEIIPSVLFPSSENQIYEFKIETDGIS